MFNCTKPTRSEDPEYVRILTAQIIYSVMKRVIALYYDPEEPSVVYYEGTEQQKNEIDRLQGYHLQRMISLKNEAYKEYLFTNGMYVTENRLVKALQD